MPDPTTPTPPSPRIAAVESRSLKTAVVAGLLLAFALVSGGAMLWSGWLLLRGEQVPYPWTRLPKSCAWVAVADEPGHTAAAWRTVAALPQVPAAWRALATGEATRWDGVVAQPGVDPAPAWGLCARAPQPVLAVAPVVAATGALPGAAGPLAAFAPYLRWASAPLPWGAADAVAAEHTPLPTAASGETLEQDDRFREAMERTGGGQVHLYLPQHTVTQWAAGVTDPIVRAFLPLGTFAAVALRVDADHVVVHAHIGTGQRGAVYLKQHLDPTHDLDAATLIDPAAPVRGVARLHPAALDLLRTRHPLLGLLDRWMAQHTLEKLAPYLTGQVAWQQFSPTAGTDVALTLSLATNAGPLPWQGTCAVGVQEPGLACRMGAGYLVVGSSAAAADRADAVAAGRTLSLRTAGGLGPDVERLLTQTQGLHLGPGARVDVPGLRDWTGPLQVEAVWVDSGLAAEIAVPRTAGP